MGQLKIAIPGQKIEAFCRKWRVKEFSLFGSVIRDDFGPGSDVDVMVQFADDTRWGLSELGRMEQELEAIFGRKVDLITRRSVEENPNPIRRRHLLSEREILHVAG
jgi:hypothetical protein